MATVDPTTVLTILRGIETLARFAGILRLAIEAGRDPTPEEWSELDGAILDARSRLIAASIRPPLNIGDRREGDL